MAKESLIRSSMLMAFVAAVLISAQPSAVCVDQRAPAGITGVLWKWEQTLYNNDQKAAPPDPSHYTITFKPDGALQIRADCNRAGGNYSLHEKTITIQVTHSTRAACPPDSLEQTFLKDLNSAAIYFFNDCYLYFDLKYDTGTMKFGQLLGEEMDCEIWGLRKGTCGLRQTRHLFAGVITV